MESTENTENADNVEDIKSAKDETEQEMAEETVEAASTPVEEDFKEKYYYLAAEMQNMQRRFDNEKTNLLKFGNERLLNDMIDVVDNLERTIGFIETDEDEKVKNIVVGIEMIHKMFLDNLEKHGLSQIKALGEEFDPHFHEALAHQTADDKKENEIILVHQTGYKLNERVIRAAKVVIVKNA